MKKSRNIKDILQSTSETLFPAGMGEEEVELNSKCSDGDTPLHIIAGRNDKYGIEQLVAAGARIDVAGDLGETPLHVALRTNSIKSVEALLWAGAKTDIKSEFGESAREISKRKGGLYEKLFRQFRRN